MLKEKLNLKTIFCCLNIIAFVIFYIRIDMEVIDVLYLTFVFICIIKNFYIEFIKGE